jgi:hypothetical protein
MVEAFYSYILGSRVLRVALFVYTIYIHIPYLRQARIVLRAIC